MVTENQIKNMITLAGGVVGETGSLPDGSGFATASFPLRSDHWLYAGEWTEPPPMPFRMGTADPRREQFNAMVRAAGRYAVRAATTRGKSDDFDPDAMGEKLIIGMPGYYTADGLCGESWADPAPVPAPYPGSETPT